MNLLLLMLMVAGVKTTELSIENYADRTEGKTAFILFYAPWCSHCKRIRAGWDRLMRKNSDENILIAEVDCTDRGKDLCEDHDITGYPTIKWGNPDALEIYTGERTRKALKNFARELKPVCIPAKLELCNEEEKEIINKFTEMSLEDLSKEIKEDEKKIRKANRNYEEEVAKLQESFRKVQATRVAAVQKLKSPSFKALKAVLKYKVEEASPLSGKKNTAGSTSSETPEEDEKKETPEEDQEKETPKEDDTKETPNKEEL